MKRTTGPVFFWRRRGAPTSNALLALFVSILVVGDSLAAERLPIEVVETAGLRRFNYPVGYEFETPKPVPSDTPFALRLNDQPERGQFRPLTEGPLAKRWRLDFHVDFGPYEKIPGEIVYGKGVTPEEGGGLRLESDDKSLRVQHPGALTFTLSRNATGFLDSVVTDLGDFLRPGSAGLGIVARNGEQITLGGASSWSVVWEGPSSIATRYSSRERLKGDLVIDSRVDCDFPLGKSWVKATWTIEDPKDLVSEMNLGLNLALHDLEGNSPTPTLLDFATPELTYMTLAPNAGHVAELSAGPGRSPKNEGASKTFWKLMTGESGKTTSFAQNETPVSDLGRYGWAHVMDSRRCTAIAISGFGDHQDRMEVSGDGTLKLGRGFAKSEQRAANASEKQFEFWLHFVTFPAHVGAVTSPQSMLFPPLVRPRAE